MIPSVTPDGRDPAEVLKRKLDECQKKHDAGDAKVDEAIKGASRSINVLRRKSQQVSSITPVPAPTIKIESDKADVA